MPPLAPRARVVAVDYGARRVGLAVTDPLGLFAQPAGTFAPGEALVELVRLHEVHSLATVVVGWPLDAEGREGASVDRVRPFVGRLRKALPDVEVAFQDERDSSRRAVEALVAAGVTRGARREKARVDAAAAVVILTDWLEEREDEPDGAG